jgi:RES domain-containing protein
MPREPRGRDVATVRVEWAEAWRIIASRFPPINLFERVSNNPAVWESLMELEQITNPRIRDEAGDISLVPANRRVSGPNASWVMAAFTHVNRRGSRFSNGSYGVYYAAETLATAIAETIYHFAKFASDSNDPARREDMRVLLGQINARYDDLPDGPEREQILSKTTYTHSQAFALERRSSNSDGIIYPSVRADGGRCIAAFWPDTVGIPIQERHLKYEWDGKRVSRYFDFKDELWMDIPA